MIRWVARPWRDLKTHSFSYLKRLRCIKQEAHGVEGGGKLVRIKWEIENNPRGRIVFICWESSDGRGWVTKKNRIADG